MRLALGATCCAAVLMAAAGGAQAAQRFAAPAPAAGADCSQGKPCSLKEALSGAGDGDEVIVTAGTYSLDEGVATPAGKVGVDVHGAAGTVPKIVGGIAGTLFAVGAESRLSQVEVENVAKFSGGISCGRGAEVDRVRVRVTGEFSTAFQQGGTCALRDSLLLAEGKLVTGLLSSGGQETALARNLTVIASGAESIGAKSEGFGFNEGPVHTLNLKDSIVRAATDLASDFFSLMIAGVTIEGTGDISVSYSNFASTTSVPNSSVSEGPGNQKAPPLFVDAAKGDYREAAGSPTIDAGVADQLGPLDLDGNARVIGAAPDIGAFEFVPPIGRLDSLAVKPKKFRAGNAAGAVASAKKKKAPLGANVSYGLSAPGAVDFHVERAGTGRKVGKSCVKKTRANKGHKKCTLYKPLTGRFSLQGAAGANSFKFSGKVAGKSLKPGPYRLVGSAGDSILRAPFKIVK